MTEIETNTREKWDRRFFELSRLVATWSEDQSRKVGAVIVGPANDIRAIGFNGLPRLVSSEPEERHSRQGGEKYYWFEHAERNAIYNAARSGISTEGCRMYTSLFPCADCTRGIIQSGIVELNSFHAPDVDEVFQRSFEVAKIMLNEAGIAVRLFSVDFLRAGTG
ncbi:MULTISPECIES: deaminase [unclassified Bradyrhizobium]|uniref:deoxycytidylate deaminase n=1 Tax=unclassified Bradyrhizobium TaxID=2631580 RepID=UPI001FF7F721|nr:MULTISPECIES: deaminase [unclassified Bradyrhizobium]MCK1289381.1 dCMP deaminase [Bradyrhizobium sp. 30]MCK1497899.1 dCMP deaminase [Bradyrhizobium sp. 188]